MKVLILTCNTGGGHNSAAASLREAFVSAGCECDVADALQFISKRATLFMSSGHNWMYRHAPAVFNFGYRFSEQHPSIFSEDSEVYKFLTAGTERIKAHIAGNGYDLVMCTHVLSSLILTGVMKDGTVHVRTCMTATDYTCSPSLEESRLDWYFIPDASLADEFVEKGLPGERLIPTGIPVSSGFERSVPLEEAKRRQNIRPDQKHLLVMCGSMGCGPIKDLAEELAERLPENAVMTVICGTNEALYRKLSQKIGDGERIRVLGFTDKVSELMESADLYLTKAGGLSTSEALNKHLPLCLIKAVAGCEAYNANYFVSRGMAAEAESEQDLARFCLELLVDDERLGRMKDQMVRYAPGNSAEKIVNFLINGVK